MRVACEWTSKGDERSGSDQHKRWIHTASFVVVFQKLILPIWAMGMGLIPAILPETWGVQPNDVHMREATRIMFCAPKRRKAKKTTTRLIEILIKSM